jgi:hypothetical protein
MYMVAKKIGLGLFILISIFLLLACSSAPSDPISSSVEITPTSLPKDTSAVTPPKETATTNQELTEIPITEPTMIKETAIEEKTVLSTGVPSKKIPASSFADVISVQVSGAENSYQLSVEIHSPDIGCEQYADWWEVITEDGELIYRRILAHSHVSEQPFTRSGGPVVISADKVVIVRAHMYPEGYGGAAFRGSVQGGFEEISLDMEFAADLERVDPLPEGCAF